MCASRWWIQKPNCLQRYLWRRWSSGGNWAWTSRNPEGNVRKICFLPCILSWILADALCVGCMTAVTNNMLCSEMSMMAWNEQTKIEHVTSEETTKILVKRHFLAWHFLDAWVSCLHRWMEVTAHKTWCGQRFPQWYGWDCCAKNWAWNKWQIHKINWPAHLST